MITTLVGRNRLAIYSKLTVTEDGQFVELEARGADVFVERLTESSFRVQVGQTVIDFDADGIIVAEVVEGA